MSGQTLSLPAVPVVTIFVRHSADCPHKDDEFHRNCRCRKHLRWSYAGQQQRKSAKTRSWTAAEQARRKLEAQYETADPTKRIETLTIAASSSPTIERARELFISNKRSQGVSSDVLKKYERELTRFSDFLEERSRLFPHEITLEDLTEFRANWETLYPSSTTRSKVQERLRGYLRYCYDSRLIDRVAFRESSVGAKASAEVRRTQELLPVFRTILAWSTFPAACPPLRHGKLACLAVQFRKRDDGYALEAIVTHSSRVPPLIALRFLGGTTFKNPSTASGLGDGQTDLWRRLSHHRVTSNKRARTQQR